MASADLTWSQACVFYYDDDAGGTKAAEDLFAKFNIMDIRTTIGETETEAMSNKKLEKPADFKGLTWRGAGYSPLIVQEPEFGGSGVILATADVYTALQTHVIDACEVGNAFSNYGSGYQEVTKFWSFPGIHQLCQTSSTLVNMDEWKKLPEDIQWCVRTASVYYNIRAYAFQHLESAKIIPVLQQKYGITIVRETPELQTMWKTVAWRILDQWCQKSPDFKAMWKMHTDLMAQLSDYESLQTVQYVK